MYANCSLCGKRFQSESHIEFHVQRFYEYGEPICFISMWIVWIKGTRWQCEARPYNWIPWESWKNLDWFSRNSWSCPRLDCTQKNNAGSIRSWFCWWFSKDNNKKKQKLNVEESFQCTVCGFSFTRKGNLKRHQINNHRKYNHSTDQPY